MAERILIADDDPTLRTLLETVLEMHEFDVVSVSNGDALVRTAREILPDLLLVDIMMPVMDGLEAIRQLRHDTRTAHIPMLLLTAHATPQQAVIGFESGADDYITKPFNNDLLVARVKANLRRAARRPANNPLTGLPGNVLIEEEVAYRLRNDRPFALLWLDLDNFKSFNDAYGFARGDRVIRLLGDLILDLKRERNSDEDFAGHIGGDDFVIVSEPVDAVEISKQVIAHFDDAVRNLYDPADLERGYLMGVDRFGTPRRFPLVSLSIGIVDTSRRQFASYDEVAVVAAEVKGFAKKAPGSSYALDERRRSAAAPPPTTERRGQAPLVVITCGGKALCERLQGIAELTGSRVKTYAAYATDIAPAVLAVEAPDLVVLDASLPSAWQTLSDLRASTPALPILMVVSGDGEDQRALEAGANAAVPHSVTAEQFVNNLAQLLRLSVHSLPLS
jgi:DNA-binding response OmpR family regulator